jgi:hypothetical protein
MINSWPGPANSWEGVDAYFTWADSSGMLVLITLAVVAVCGCIIVAAAMIIPKHIAAVTKVKRTSIPVEPAHVK